MKELNPTWIAILKNHPNNNHLLEDLCKNAQAVLFYLAMIWQINQQSLPQNKHFVSLLKESKSLFSGKFRY
ncbi:MAG: hypothetical protein HWD59_08155 [Coxiellaceae bacterium]|nr:MAG: hypothetical protein HWD59_08155 [Coxiellaceae bacterium]